MEQQVIGLEVSKAWLDGYWSASGRRLRVGNDAAGSGRWSGRLATMPPAWW